MIVIRLFAFIWIFSSPINADSLNVELLSADIANRKLDKIASRFSPQLMKEGFFSEPIGYAAQRWKDCGMVTIDYSPLVNGFEFLDVLDKLSEAVSTAHTAFPYLFSEIWDKETIVQMNASKKEMETLFNGYKGNFETVNETVSKQLDNHLVIATVDVGGLGANAMKDLKGWFIGFNSNQDKALDEMARIYDTFTEDWAKLHKKTTNALLAEIYSTRISSMMSRVRDLFRNELTETLDELMIKGRISKRLARIGQKRGVWDAIMKMIGDRASQSLLAQAGVKSLSSVDATVTSMNKDTIRMKVCYPIAEISDKSEVYHIEPAGSIKKFDSDLYFTFPNTHRYWMKPSSCNSIQCLEPIIFEKCEMLGSVLLCDRGGENLGICPLVVAERKNCTESKIPVQENKFLLQRNLLTKVVVATDAKYGTLTFEGNSTIENFVIEQNVFAVELPKDSILTIYSIKVNSRIQSAIQMIKVEVTPEVPTNPTLPDLPFFPLAYVNNKFNWNAFFKLNAILFDLVLGATIYFFIVRSCSSTKNKTSLGR